MARNDSLNIRLNAQANITNIDKIKKELSQVMNNISLDKSVEQNLNRAIERMTKLQKAFDEISKKFVFNDKDMQKISTITEELESNVKQISITMKSINTDGLIKSTTQYKTLMEDINKEALKIKQNFKNLTGSDFDKEIRNIDTLKNNIEELNKAKQELQTNGVSNEYNRLLEVQNQKLQEQETKLKSLKQLQSEIVAYQNQAAQSKGYSGYEELQKIATTRTNKTDFTNQKLLEAEQAEVKRLSEEYQKFENQLKRIEQYKNQGSKTRGYKKLSEQLGIDNSTAAEIDKVIKKMQELTEVTAKTNVNNNTGLKQSINEQYNQLVQMRDAAREYVNIINRTANAKVSVSNITNTKTLNGLVNDIISTQATVNSLSSGENDDNLLTRAENNVTSAINGLDTQIEKLGTFFSSLISAQKSLYALEAQEKDYMRNASDSLKNVDSDTSDIASNTANLSEFGKNSGLGQNVTSVIDSAKTNFNNLVTELSQNGTQPAEIKTEGSLPGTVGLLVDELNKFLSKGFSSRDTNGNVDWSKFSSKEILDAQYALGELSKELENEIKITEKQEIVSNNLIKNLQEEITQRQQNIKELTQEKLDIGKRVYSHEGTPQDYNRISDIDKETAESDSIVEKNKQEIDKLQEELQIFSSQKKSLNEVSKQTIGLLNQESEAYKKQNEVIESMSTYEVVSSAYDDAQKQGDVEKQNYYKNLITQMQSAQQVENNENKSLQELFETKKRLETQTNLLTQSLQKEANEMRNSSVASKTFNETFGQATSFIGTYLSLNYIINQVFATIRKGITTVKAMDDSMVQIGIVTNKTAQEAWASFETYNNQAKRLHMTTTDLLEATKLYYQQGLNTAEVNEMVEATAVAAALGEVSMADAANTLTAIMNGYSMAATQAMEVTDKISAVGADSAADFGELSSAIEKVASSAATAGVDLDHLLGYLGKMVEVTREAPTNIGSAMKTIVARMAELKEDPTTALEDGVDVNKVQTALRTVGIELFDTTNQMRDLDDIIDELGEKWNDLSRNSQAYLATVIAGNRQQSRFLALMNDYDRTMELVASAQDSAGRSSQQFRNYATGIESSLNNIKAEAEAFYASLTSGNSAVKGAYDLIADLLGLINKLGPALSIAGTAITAFFAKLASNRSKANAEKAQETIANNLILNQRNDSENQITGIGKGTLIDNAGHRKLTNAFMGQSKQLVELNKLINIYNNEISKGIELNQLSTPLTQKQTNAITQLAKEQSISTKQATQMYIAQQKQNVGTKALTASTLAYTAAQAAATVGITLAISAAVKLISWLSDLNAANRERAAQSAEIAQKASDEANSLETLVNKYVDLKNQFSLTAEEQEELKTLNEELAESYPDLVKWVNEEGEAYLGTTQEIQKYLREKQKAANEAEINSIRDANVAASAIEGKAGSKNPLEFILPWAISYSETNTEDSYGESSAGKLEELQNAANRISRFTGFTKNTKLWGVGFSPFGLTEELMTDPDASIDEYEKYIEEIRKTDEKTAEKMEIVARKYREWKEAAKEDMINNYELMIEDSAENELIDANLDSDETTMGNSLITNFTNSIVNAQKEVIKDTDRLEEWLKENQDDISKNLSAVIIRVLKSSQSDEFKQAYQAYLDAQENGETDEVINERRAQVQKMLSNFVQSDDEKKWINQWFANSIQSSSEDREEAITQALESLGVTENNANYQKMRDAITNIYSKQGQNIRDLIDTTLAEISSDEELFGGNEQQKNAFSQKMISALNTAINSEEIGAALQQDLNNLDPTSALDVQTLHEKWDNQLMNIAEQMGMTEEEQQLFIEKLIPRPGSIIEEVGEAISKALTDASTINGQSIQDLFAGDYGLATALEDGFNLGEGTIVGDQFLVNTSIIIDKMGEANEALKTQIENLKIGAMEEGQAAIEEIQNINNQISAIQFNAQANNRNLTDVEQSKIDELQKQKDELQDQLSLSSQQIENAKRLNDQLEEQTRKQQLLASQSFYNDYNSGVNQQISSLKDLASAYDEIKEGELSQLDIIEMIANNSDMLTAVYVNERGELALNKTALEELAKAKIKTAIADGETKIAQLENLKSMIDANKYYTEDERQTLEQKVKMNEDLERDQEELKNNTQTQLQGTAGIWDNWVNGLITNVIPAFSGFLTSMLTGVSDFKTKSYNILDKVFNYIQSVKDGINGEARNVDDMMYFDDKTFQSELKLTGSAVDENGVLNVVLNRDKDTSSDDTWIDLSSGIKSNTKVENIGSDIKTEGSISGQEYINQIQKQIDQIRATNNALQNMYDSGTILENIASMGGAGENSEKNKDEFEAYMEYFEKFYNYMKQIQDMEAKINRLREKRNIIDANKNYYIEDLKKENELLSQQAAIYNDYIRAQQGYLADLRNQISSAYGDLAYFTDEGLLQLRVSEVYISSESQEERIKEFQRLMEEYESQYESMQENETKLYEIESTQIENITSMYDKLLQRLEDVRENLEFMQSVSEHKITMAYGDLETLDLLNDKLLTTIDLWSNADKTVADLEADMKLISEQVQGSNLGQFLQWDQDLNQYRITDAFYDDLVRQEWENMGANWAEVTTWVTKTAKESEEVAEKWRDAKDSLMSAEETLKSIVEDRLSKINDLLGAWSGEFTEVFDVIQRALDRMSTEGDLFGNTPQSLQKQYEATAAAASIAKANITELKKLQSDALDEITQKYSKYVSMTEYGAYINETAIKESKELSESEKTVLLEKIAVYDNITEALEGQEDKLYEYLQTLQDFEEEKRQAIIDIKTEIHDELMQQDQDEVDDLQKKYDEMSRIDTEYYNSLQQKISDARDARTQQQSALEIDQMRAQIAVMQKDNTSQYNQELIELQKQLQEQLQAQADAEVDRELERIQREQQEREADRQLQIQQMENLITFKDENGIYWQETQAMMEAGRQEVESFLAERLKEKDMSEEERFQRLEERNKQIDNAFAEFSGTQYNQMSNNNAETGAINKTLYDFCHNPVEIKDKEIRDKIGSTGIDVGNIITNMRNYLGNNIKGVKNAVGEIFNTRKELFNRLDKIYQKIYNPSHSSSGTGIVSGGGSGGSSSSGGGSGSSGGSGGYGGDGVARVGDTVTYTGKYYYDSWGRSPRGSLYSGQRGAVRIDSYSAKKYGGNASYTGGYDVHISSSRGQDLGWIKLNQLSGYKKGGYVDFTGPAMVHGTKNAPEAFLNARQTELFEGLRDSLSKASKNSNQTQEKAPEETIQIDSLNINVQEATDVDSIDKIINKVKSSIYKDATNGNTMKIRRR